jgi:hypothetical protein
MLIALLLALLLGGGGGGTSQMFLFSLLEGTKENIDAVVTDKDRLARAQAVIELAEQAQKDYLGKIEEIQVRLSGLAKRRTANQSEFGQVLASLDDNAGQAAQRLVTLRFELKKVLTREEWTKVFPTTVVALPTK